MTFSNFVDAVWLIYGGIGVICAIAISGAICKLILGIRDLCTEKFPKEDVQ